LLRISAVLARHFERARKAPRANEEEEE